VDKKNVLIWIDLEMTGLDPARDHILEIATIVTDNNLNIIAQGPDIVIHQPEERLIMEAKVRDIHAKSGLLTAVERSSVTLAEAEEETYDFLAQYVLPGCGILSGNTVWQDRSFLVAYMPRILNLLHYRLIDVSTVKELIKRWYPDHNKVHFVKPNNHRALEDIQGSIAELAHYRMNFFIK